jgi:hypothetical protein
MVHMRRQKKALVATTLPWVIDTFRPPSAAKRLRIDEGKLRGSPSSGTAAFPPKGLVGMMEMENTLKRIDAAPHSIVVAACSIVLK